MIHKLDLMDTCRILNPTIGEHTFSSNTHGTFTKIRYTLYHKSEVINFTRSGAILETEAAEKKLND